MLVTLDMIIPYKVITIVLATLWLICDGLALQPDTGDRLLNYSREELLLLGPPCDAAPSLLGFYRQSFDRGPLPLIMLSNVRSLQDKIDLLHAWCQLGMYSDVQNHALIPHTTLLSHP